MLFTRIQCDVLLSLAHANLYSTKWSASIMNEWMTAVARKYPGKETAIQKKADDMNAAIPD